MTAKIEKLTPQQEIQLRDWHAEWFRIGTSTEPADRPRAEAAITAMYAEMGEKVPHFIWFDSPATAVMGQWVLKNYDKKLLEHSLRASLRASLGASLWASLWDSLRASLWDSLGDSLGDSLRDSLRASLWDSLGDGNVNWSFYWGQHDAYWVAYYKFCSAVVGVQYEPKRLRQLELWSEVSQSCGWWQPYRGLVLMCERPTVVQMEPTRDNRYRLHCADGPALQFQDGWSVYSWHGLRIPEQIIMQPETITVQSIRDEQNAEIRRVMLERFGFDRYIRESGAKLLHRDDWGTLWRAEVPNDEPLVMVQVVNATPEPDGSFHEYFLRVHPELRPLLESNRFGEPQELTARNAVASTVGLQGDGYNPVYQT